MPIPFGRESGSAFATRPRPKLPTCLVKMLLPTSHPILKLLTPRPKQRADAERQHCMRKICSVVVSNLSGALTCATMLWELIRISQELLFLIGCSTGSEIKQLVHWEKCCQGILVFDRVLVPPLGLPEANKVCFSRSMRKNTKIVAWRKVLRSLPQMQLCKLPSLTVSRVFSFAHCRNYQMKCTEYFDASEISWRRSDCPWMPWILPFCMESIAFFLEAAFIFTRHALVWQK